MKTRQKLAARLDWYIGKYIDPDKKYGFQCADVPTDLVKWATGITMTGDARNLIYNDFKGQAEVLINTPELEILQGDILIYTFGRFDNDFGHVTIAYKNITLQSCLVLEQNWDNDADTPVKTRLDYYEGLSHIIRIKFKEDESTLKNAKKKYQIENGIVRGLPQNEYYYGKPTSIVMHETGNDTSKIDGEINYMSNNWQSAFVHSFIDADHIYETANTDYSCWGAGPGINPYAIQGELIHEHTKERFLLALDRYLFWFGFQMYWYDIKPDDATIDGDGTVWTHEAVSKFLGSTDHVDPMPYIRSRGAEFGLNITWSMLYNKLIEYINALYKGDSTQVKMIGENKSAQAVTPNKAAVAPETAIKTVSYDKKKYRKRSLNGAYIKGVIDNETAEVRKRTGSKKTGFKFTTKAGYDLKEGATVYIFETHNGWGRIYTADTSGKGSNEWVHLDRVQVTKVYK